MILKIFENLCYIVRKAEYFPTNLSKRLEFILFFGTFLCCTQAKFTTFSFTISSLCLENKSQNYWKRTVCPENVLHWCQVLHEENRSRPFQARQSSAGETNSVVAKINQRKTEQKTGSPALLYKAYGYRDEELGNHGGIDAFTTK